MAPPLQDLANELVSDPGYISGRRRFPRTINLEDALAIVDAFHGAMDEAARFRAAQAEQRGRPVACHAGCAGCCEEPVMIFLPEALRIASFLLQPENAAIKQAFLDAYPRWKEKAGDGPQRLSDLFRAGDAKGHFHEFVAQWRKRNLCAFNSEGLCTIYSVRPLVCRNAHAVGTAEHCVGDDQSGGSAVRIADPRVDNFFEKGRKTLRALHHALGGETLATGSVCEWVHDILTRQNPA